MKYFILSLLTLAGCGSSDVVESNIPDNKIYQFSGVFSDEISTCYPDTQKTADFDFVILNDNELVIITYSYSSLYGEIEKNSFDVTGDYPDRDDALLSFKTEDMFETKQAMFNVVSRYVPLCFATFSGTIKVLE